MIEPTDEQLLEEYNKEIHKEYAKQGEMTVARLIKSHRNLRNLNIEWNGAFDEARAKGYNAGYDWGVRNVAANSITLDELRKMTIQELANLIGTDYD
jgi:hypothetical protein